MSKRNLMIVLLIGILTITQSCNIFKKTTNSNKKRIETLYFYQNGKEKIINSKSILVKREKFSIRFYNKKYNSETNEFYSTQIAAFLDIKELDKIKIGTKTQNSTSFKPGSGIATDRSGKYENLIFDNNGHHYLLYENSESKRLNLIKKGAVYQKLEFEIASLYYNNNKVTMNETNLTEFYLAILIDRNLNGIIDKGELTKLTVKIK